MRTIARFIFVALVLGCGGGGGSGPDGRGVRMLHAALTQPPVELSVATRPETVQRAVFGTAGDYVALEEGAHAFTVKVPVSGRPLGSLAATLENEQRISLLLFGEQQLTVLRDDPVLTSEQAMLRLVHGVFAASTLDLALDNRAVLSGVGYGGGSAYQAVSAGQVRYVVSRSADRLRLASGVGQLEAGKAYTLLAAGEAGYFVHAQLLRDR